MAAAVAQKVLMGSANLVAKLGGAVGRGVGSVTPHTSKFFNVAKVEFAPPSQAELAQLGAEVKAVKDGVSQFKFLDMTVNEVAVNGLFVAEVFLLFHVGEVIGRKSLIGYNPKVE